MMLGPVEGLPPGRTPRSLRHLPARIASPTNPATYVGDGCPAPA